MNLLKETLEVLAENKKVTTDVKWCGSEEFGSFLWEDFVKLADFEYDSGYGGQEIAKDLLIVGGDWWLERHKYDGSEWWEFKKLPSKPTEKVPDKLKSEDSWATLVEVNREGGKYI